MEAMLFLMGFSAIVTVYEITKESKPSKSDKLNKAINSTTKKLPKM